ncbi:MAG TPA: hypothetical protein DCL21_05665 [Alphaproteobacteria bacterium]|nr:hypothetical protein [Alphaproteobacteria bacterium]
MKFELDTFGQIIVPNDFYNFAKTQYSLNSTQIQEEFNKCLRHHKMKGIQILDWHTAWTQWLSSPYCKAVNESKQQNFSKPTNAKPGVIDAMKEVDCLIEESGLADERPASKYL